MGDIIKLRKKKTKHRLRLDADARGYFVNIFPPPAFPNPTWRFESYDDAKSKADMLSTDLGMKVHDAIRPPFMEHFK